MHPNHQRPVRVRRRLPWNKPALSALLGLLLGGCFSYRPTEVSRVEPNATVRVSLADTELPRLRAFIDARESTVSGRFVSASPDSMTMVVQTPLAFQEVSIARSAVLGVEAREADKIKNILIAGGLVGGAGLLAYLGFDGGGNKINRPGPQPEDSRLPLFRVGIPLP